ncbi:hypothetical protein Nmel_014957 [Mimus melanotis]
MAREQAAPGAPDIAARALVPSIPQWADLVLWEATSMGASSQPEHWCCWLGPALATTLQWPHNLVPTGLVQP